VTVSAAASVLLLLSAAPQEPPRFSSQVGNVYLDAFVTHKGGPVLGLVAENFEVRDNGVRQEVRLVSLEVVPVAVLLVFDTSSSVAGDALDHLQAAGHAVVDALRPGERAALITFNQGVVVRVPPSDDLARVRKELDSIKAYGATSLYDAAYVALALRVHGARSLVVLFSDGEDTTSWLKAEDIRFVAARSDLVLQAVGVTDRTSVVGNERMVPPFQNRPSHRTDDLGRIAEATGGRLWKAERPEHLKDTFLEILEEMRTRYLLTFEPTGVEHGGEHRLEVRLKGAKGKVRSRRSYYGTPHPE
jgi:VWFA-related protein